MEMKMMDKLKKLAEWNGNGGFQARTSAQGMMLAAEGAGTACGSAFGASDPEKKPSACGTACGTTDPEKKPSACGTACGTSDPEKKPSASGSSCGTSAPEK